MVRKSVTNDPWAMVAAYLLSTQYVVEDAIRELGLDLDPREWTFEKWTQYDIDCCDGCSHWFDIEELYETENGHECNDCKD